VWAEFLRGAPPVGADEWDVHRFDAHAYDAYLAHARPQPRFWDGAVDGRVITLDVPRVTAAEDDDGVHVVGWGAAQVFAPRSSQPRGLLRDIDERFGPHPMERNDQMGWHEARRIEDAITPMERGARRRARVLQYLLHRFPDWQLCIAVWSEMHPAGEFLWHGVDRSHLLAGHSTATVARDALRRLYRAVDDGIGAFVQELPDDVAVVVFALNGLRTGHGDTASGVLLPELLSRWYTGRSMLQADDASRWERRGCPPLVPGPCQRQGYFTARRVDGGRGRVVQRVSERLPAGAWPVQQGLRRAAAAVAPGSETVGPLGLRIPNEQDVDAASLAAARVPLEQVASWYQPQWHTMPAFALPSFGEGQVRLNVAGREADGIVAPDDYDATLADLTERLSRCTSPRTGASVVRRIDRTSDGPAHDAYADLTVVWDTCIDALRHPDTGVIGPFPLQRLATHTPDGFAHVSAPGVVPGHAGIAPLTELPAMIRSLLAAPASSETESVAG
jgi:predicted AlkP superfamily phosphohydrolase/phosphomutase